MSDLTQAALVSGGVFAVVMASQYGRRAYQVKDLVRPLAMVAGIGWFYLRGMPTGTHELSAYAVAVVLGLLFAAGASVTTGLERDDQGRVFTRCGPAFAGVWLLAVALRLGFVWSAENVTTVHDHVGLFMLAHHLSFDAIAPFFVLWALTMVLARLAVVAARAARLQSRPVTRPQAVLV